MLRDSRLRPDRSGDPGWWRCACWPVGSADALGLASDGFGADVAAVAVGVDGGDGLL